jgi:hypothetical protein
MLISVTAGATSFAAIYSKLQQCKHTALDLSLLGLFGLLESRPAFL